MLVLLVGCATTGTASLKDLPADWPPMGTAKEEVEARLGRPSTHSLSIEGGHQQETWIYNFGRAEANPLLFVPIAGLAVAASGQGMSGEGKALVLKFDPDGKVIARSVTTHKIGAPPAGPTNQYVK